MVCPGAQPPVVVAVLVDDASVGEVVGAVLEDAGYRTWRLAADPDQLAALRTTPPAVILLDVWQGAPQRGIALLRHLRGEPATRAVPIVALCTDGVLPERRADFRNAGCAAVLAEPFDLDALLATVAAVLAAGVDDPRGSRAG